MWLWEKNHNHDYFGQYILIIFEFENVMHLFIISLQKKPFVNENIKISLFKKNQHKMVKCPDMYPAVSIKKKNLLNSIFISLVIRHTKIKIAIKIRFLTKP